MEIRPADLFFTTSRGFISSVIRFRTWGKFSHVQVISNPKSEPHGKIEVISADDNGVTRRDAYDDEFEKCAILTCPTMTEEQRRNVVEFCIQQVGKGYDFLGLADFLLDADLQNENRFFCSELAFLAYKASGIDLIKRIDHAFASPAHLYISPLLEIIEERG
jgi:uncharacterized protein YycO